MWRAGSCVSEGYGVCVRVRVRVVGGVVCRRGGKCYGAYGLGRVCMRD